MSSTNSNPALDRLEAVAATKVRREWMGVREQLRVHKALALTSHEHIDAVLVEPAEYAALVKRAAAADQSLLAALTQRFDAQLAVLERAESRERLADAFARQGRFDADVRAGKSF